MGEKSKCNYEDTGEGIYDFFHGVKGLSNKNLLGPAVTSTCKYQEINTRNQSKPPVNWILLSLTKIFNFASKIL